MVLFKLYQCLEFLFYVQLICRHFWICVSLLTELSCHEMHKYVAVPVVENWTASSHRPKSSSTHQNVQVWTYKYASPNLTYLDLRNGCASSISQANIICSFSWMSGQRQKQATLKSLWKSLYLIIIGEKIHATIYSCFAFMFFFNNLRDVITY